MSTFARFESAFAEKPAETSVLEAVYQIFADWAPPGHRVAASDDISDVYGMVDEDFDDAVRTILRKCGCRVPPWSEAIRKPRVHTIADLVELISSICHPTKSTD